MSKEKLHSGIFVIVMALMLFISSPFMIKNHILKHNTESKEEGEELGAPDDEVELDEAFLTDNTETGQEPVIEETGNEPVDNTDITSSNTNEEVVSNSNSNTTSSSNITSNKTTTSNKTSNTTGNKPVTSNKTTTTNTGKTNKVKNPGMTYTGFTSVDSSYFADALFIGDSRTVGLRDYGNIKNASWFCDVGMSSYNINSKKLSVKGVGTVSLDQLLAKKKYSKVYIMLGINEVGYGLNQTANKYAGIVKKVRAAYPDAIIYIEANLHVSKRKNDTDKYINNDRLNNLNGLMSRLANNTNTFYIDINEYFDDANGNLKSGYTSDGVHPYAKYYAAWTNWIMKHAVQI
jgi:lysophospholipase L1-like esterase